MAKKKKAKRPHGARGPDKKPRAGAPKTSSIGRPKNWDTAVSVAYLLLMGATQAAASEATGASKRSITAWNNSKWWHEAQTEARARWLRNIEAGAMRGILWGLGNDNEKGSMSKYVADRMVHELKPPSTTLMHVSKAKPRCTSTSQTTVTAFPRKAKNKK